MIYAAVIPYFDVILPGHGLIDPCSLFTPRTGAPELGGVINPCLCQGNRPDYFFLVSVQGSGIGHAREQYLITSLSLIVTCPLFWLLRKSWQMKTLILAATVTFHKLQRMFKTRSPGLKNVFCQRSINFSLCRFRHARYHVNICTAEYSGLHVKQSLDSLQVSLH